MKGWLEAVILADAGANTSMDRVYGPLRSPTADRGYTSERRPMSRTGAQLNDFPSALPPGNSNACIPSARLSRTDNSNWTLSGPHDLLAN